MSHVRWGWAFWLVAAFGSACDGCETRVGHGGEDGADDGEVIEGELDCRALVLPFRDEWRVEVDAPFVHEGGAIASLQVGGLLTGGNFANRGDVIVSFDGEPDRIVVELRRFTTAVDEEAAREDFAALHLWAFNRMVDRPLPPSAMPSESACTGGAWDGCGIRVWYGGLAQLARAGADIRVTLPPDYEGKLRVVTEDNDDGTGYANRGNVCVHGAPAGVDVTMQSGVAFVIVGEDAVPTPGCAPEDLAACESWPAGAWAVDCPCIAAGHPFGTVRVRTADVGSADVTVDLPPDLWSAFHLANQGAGQDATTAGAFCDARVSVPGFEPSMPQDFPWAIQGSAAVPSDTALVGGGFFVDVTSARCGPLLATETPEAYDCVDEEQESEHRGDLRACTDCVRAQSCDALLP